MDLLPRVTGKDPYQGGQQQRPGTGAFARKRKEEEDRKRQAAVVGEDEPAAAGVDPLLAEIDRIRALDPDLTESGAHRALRALRAYQQAPAEAAPEPEDPFADPAPEGAGGAASEP